MDALTCWIRVRGQKPVGSTHNSGMQVTTQKMPTVRLRKHRHVGSKHVNKGTLVTDLSAEVCSL